MKLIKPHHFQLDCTGREIYAFADTFGVVEDGEGHPRLAYGYDGYVEIGETALTPAERVEIADYMIARWTAWKDESR